MCKRCGCKPCKNMKLPINSFDEVVDNQATQENILKALTDVEGTANLAMTRTTEFSDFLIGEGLENSTKDVIDKMVDSGAIDLQIEEKLTQLETDYTPRLSSVENELIEIARIPKTNPSELDYTLAIQRAIDVQNGLGGGVVYLPTGVYNVSKLVMKSRVTLKGVGSGTVIRSINNNPNQNLIEITGTVYQVRICDLKLDGNKENQTVETNGIYINTSKNVGVDEGDENHRIDNVFIKKFKGEGLKVEQTREIRINNVITFKNDKNGIWLGGSDNWLLNSTAFDNGLSGFYIIGSAMKITTCKAYTNGSSSGVSTSGHGFDFKYTSNSQMVNCESQENIKHGFYFLSCSTIIGSSLISNTNAYNGGEYGGYYLEGCVKLKLSGIASNTDGLISVGNKYAVMLAGNTLNSSLDIVARSTSSKPQAEKVFLGNTQFTNEVKVNGENVIAYNRFSNPSLVVDSNKDGIADGLTLSANGGVNTFNSSIDLVEQCQKITYLTNTANFNGQTYKVDFDVSPGDIVSAKCDSKVSTVGISTVIYTIYFDASDVQLSQIQGTDNLTTNWETLRIMSTTPANAVKCSVRIGVTNSASNVLGSGFFKNLKYGISK